MESARQYQPRPFEDIDTTFREGLQSPVLHDVGKHVLRLEERGETANALMEYGVHFFEVFSPIVGGIEPQFVAQLLGIRDEFSARTGNPVFVLAHVRAHPGDVEQAIAAGVDGLNMYMGTSEESQQFNHGKSLEAVARKSSDLLADVRKNYPNMLLRFSGEDAFRTPMADLAIVYDSVVDFVDRFGAPDTVGTANPAQVAARVVALRARYPNTDLEGHFHNDRGYALINAITALLAGMRYMQTTLLGFGERSGIASKTGLLFNLHLENPHYTEGYHIEQSYPLNVLFAQILGIQVPPTEPVSLTARTHSAGVHGNAELNAVLINAVLNGASAYEAHKLKLFGVDNSRLLLGPFSGKRVIQYYLTNMRYFMGVTDEIAQAITHEFKQRVLELDQNFGPSDLLEQIAVTCQLSRITRPVTHQENL